MLRHTHALKEGWDLFKAYCTFVRRGLGDVASPADAAPAEGGPGPGKQLIPSGPHRPSFRINVDPGSEQNLS